MLKPSKDKKAYISPPLAELTLTIIRDANPTVILSLDVGLPNYLPHFDLKFPLVEEGQGGTKVAALVREALGVLLDEVTAFMVSMDYDHEVQVQLYAAALQCFEDMTVESEAGSDMPEYTRDNVVRTYEGRFPMPSAFVEETQRVVVTAATNIKRVPVNRRIELTKLPPNKPTVNDVEKIIRLYRNRSLQQQPHRLYVMVYDQMGHPAGVLPAQNWKNQLLKKGTMGEQEGTLVSVMLDGSGKSYPQGHPVVVKSKRDNPYRFEILDANTGALITEAHTKELTQIVH